MSRVVDDSGGRRTLVRGLKWILHAFFRRLEVVGLENVPAAGGGIVVAWHPNGLVDGLLILCTCPRPVVFGARHGLFSIPALGSLLRAVGCVPLYRRQDADATATEEERKAANESSLRDLSAAAATSFVGIFPEGATHDESQPLELRYGAARLFTAARRLSADDAPPPAILPVGLHYDKKHVFRSRALVVFHPPIRVPPSLTATSSSEGGSSDGESRKAESSDRVETRQIAEITRLIETTLHDVVHATESWELHLAMERIRTLVRAERAARAGVRLDLSAMAEREMGFRRVWTAYHARRETHPDEVDRLIAQVRRYDLMMRLLRLEDRDLDSNYRGKMLRRLVRLTLEAAAAIFLLPSILVFGYAVNLPAALVVKRLARGMSKSRKEQAGLKVMLGVVLFTTTWLVVGLIVGFTLPEFWTAYSWTPRTPWLAAGAVMMLCMISGALALRYHRLIAELLRNLNTLRARTSRLETVRRLHDLRGRLFDRTMQMSEGLELPGHVETDGTISR